MALEDIYSGFYEEEAAFEAAVVGYYETLSAVAAGKIKAALAVGFVGPIVNSTAWKLGGAQLTTSIEKVQAGLIASGMRQAVAEVPLPFPRFNPRIAELAGAQAGERAVDLAKAIDDRTRAGLRTMIGRAAREYSTDPSLGALRRLQGEVRAVIGLTPKQVQRIEDWRRTALATGIPGEAVAAGVASRAAAAKDLRARAIADRGVVEAIAGGRHSAWVEARDAGDLPKNVMKQWRDQGDRHVRARHRAQSQQGPIALDKVYEIQGVQHPPSPDPGCRCWETLYVPPEGEHQVVEVPQEEEAGPTAAEESDRVVGEFGSIEASIAQEDERVERIIGDLFDQRIAIRQAIEDPLAALDDVVRTLPDEVKKLVLDIRVGDLQAELSENLTREAAARVEQRSLRERGRRLAHQVLKTQNPVFDPAVDWKSRLKPDRRSRVQEGLDWLRSVLSKDPREGAQLAVEATARSRSYQSGQGIFMAKQADAGTVVHELGHWFERDPEILRRSAEFLAKRTEGEAAQRLSRILPGYGYRADEVALRDKFVNPYTGKVYKLGGQTTATEILSMGLENMFRDPLGFAREDREFFDFVLSFLKGLF